MAKTTEKKEFAWDTEVAIGEFGNDKERHSVNICTLNGKTYVQDIKEVHTKNNGWKRTKGNTMTLDTFKELQRIVGDYELTNAFGTSSGLIDMSKPNKANSPKEQVAEAKLRGKKLSIRERLEKLDNFNNLPADKQAKLMVLIETGLEEMGMIGVVISKVSFSTASGVPKDQAERALRQYKGFSKAQFVYLTK